MTELKEIPWEEARIEQIGTGKHSDLLMISNRKPNLWIAIIFNGYEQLGVFRKSKPHAYKEGENILIKRGPVKKKFLFFRLTIKDVIAIKGDPECQ